MKRSVLIQVEEHFCVNLSWHVLRNNSCTSTSTENMKRHIELKHLAFQGLCKWIRNQKTHQRWAKTDPLLPSWTTWLCSILSESCSFSVKTDKIIAVCGLWQSFSKIKACSNIYGKHDLVHFWNCELSSKFWIMNYELNYFILEFVHWTLK